MVEKVQNLQKIDIQGDCRLSLSLELVTLKNQQLAIGDGSNFELFFHQVLNFSPQFSSSLEFPSFSLTPHRFPEPLKSQIGEFCHPEFNRGGLNPRTSVGDGVCICTAIKP